MFDRETYALLLDFYKNGQLKFDYLCSKTKHDEKASPSKYISALKRAGMISGWESDYTINDLNDRECLGFRITLAGRAYVEQKRRELLQFWVPYAITTFIAISSLIVAIVK